MLLVDDPWVVVRDARRELVDVLTPLMSCDDEAHAALLHRHSGEDGTVDEATVIQQCLCHAVHDLWDTDGHKEYRRVVDVRQGDLARAAALVCVRNGVCKLSLQSRELVREVKLC